MEAADATRQAQEARAFGWELAELMLEALLGPSDESEATAIGRHAADVIEERALTIAAEGDAENAVQVWADAASWGFRDRMAIGRELAGQPSESRRASSVETVAPDHDVAAWLAIGGRDDAEADVTSAAEADASAVEAAKTGSSDEPAPEPPKPARSRKAKAARSRAKPAVSKPRRRPKPVPVE